MRNSRTRLWRWAAIGLISWPLLSSSCVDIAQRSVVNGFFDAFIPLMDTILWERWTA